MSRLPLRLRLTLVFATVMAIVLAAMAFFVYERVGAALASSIDQSLRLQAVESGRDLSDSRSLIDPDTTTGVKLAELLDGGGAVLRATPAGLPPLLAGADAARVAAGARLVSTTRVAGRKSDWRLLAVPVKVDGRSVCARPARLARRARGDSEPALPGVPRRRADRSPARRAGRLWSRRRGASPGGVDARARRCDHRLDTGPALARAAGP